MQGFTHSAYKGMFKANGNVSPGVFLKQDVTADFALLQAGAGDVPIGISPLGHRNPPYNAGGGTSLDDGYNAIQNEGQAWASLGEFAYVQIGAAVTRGDLLKPNASGQAITAVAASGAIAGARALMSGSVVGSLVLCLVIQPTAA